MRIDKLYQETNVYVKRVKPNLTNDKVEKSGAN